MTGEGIDELRAFLNEDVPKLSLEEAKFRQSLGLNEWDPLPEGVACSCQNTSRNSGV